MMWMPRYSEHPGVQNFVLTAIWADSNPYFSGPRWLLWQPPHAIVAAVAECFGEDAALDLCHHPQMWLH